MAEPRRATFGWRSARQLLRALLARPIRFDGAPTGSPKPGSSKGDTPMSAHQFSFPAIDGSTLALKDFAGRPVLVVNTASQCGFTPQYQGLQSLWERYRDRGLVVLGVPSNDFGGQEPAGEPDIRQFCEFHFSVDFPMTAKQVVDGPAAHPFYRWVVESAGAAAAPKWNFHKYLIDGEGRLVAAWPSRTTPSDPALIGAIEAALPAGKDADSGSRPAPQG